MIARLLRWLASILLALSDRLNSSVLYAEADNSILRRVKATYHPGVAMNGDNAADLTFQSLFATAAWLTKDEAMQGFGLRFGRYRSTVRVEIEFHPCLDRRKNMPDAIIDLGRQIVEVNKRRVVG